MFGLPDSCARATWSGETSEQSIERRVALVEPLLHADCSMPSRSSVEWKSEVFTTLDRYAALHENLVLVVRPHGGPARGARQKKTGNQPRGSAVPPGGRIIVCEEFRTPDRLALQLFWTYFLIGVDGCVSRLREVEWYTSALSSLGFVDVRVLRGTCDLVTAVATCALG
jgi:hypothetical protein